MMAAGRTFSAQKALNTCADHEHEELDMYCKKCKKPVCTKCVKEDHRKHDWDTLAKIAKTLRKDTRRTKMEMKSVSKSILLGIEEEFKNITLDEESQFEFNKSEMESSRKEIIESVNKMFDEMKSKSQKTHVAKMKSIQGQREKIRTKKERVQFLIQNMEIGAKDYTDADLIELHNEIKQLIEDLQKIGRFPDSWYYERIYRKGFYDDSSLLPIIGSVEVREPILNVVLEREFLIGETPTNCIRLCSESEAWIHSTKTTEIKLVNNKGHVKKILDFKTKFYSFVMSNEKIMYCCNRDARRVDEINASGQIDILFSTAPFFPLCINLTRSGDLLVTLVDEDSNLRDSSSRRLVRRMSKGGETLKEYEYEGDNKHPLFCVPGSIIEHYDGRICVTNVYENSDGEISGTIYCFDGIGRDLFKYDGIDDDFNPLDICCAPQGNTLVSDCCPQRIHILNSSGILLRFLLLPDLLHERPYAMDFNKNKLWIGCKDSGLIKVFKHTN